MFGEKKKNEKERKVMQRRQSLCERESCLHGQIGQVGGVTTSDGLLLGHIVGSRRGQRIGIRRIRKEAVLGCTQPLTVQVHGPCLETEHLHVGTLGVLDARQGWGEHGRLGGGVIAVSAGDRRGEIVVAACGG